MEYEVGQEIKPTEKGLDREGLVASKVEAILKQTPDLGAAAAQQQAEQEVDDGIAIWGAIDKKFGWYRITGEGQETMNRWKGQVDGILEALKMKDYTTAAAAVGEDIHAADIQKKIDTLSAEALSIGEPLREEVLILVAIGLWIEQQQGGEFKMYAMLRRVIWKTLIGESESLEQILNRRGTPNCIDTSYATKAMAEQYGIEGDVVPTAPGVTAHRYYRTAGGTISDYWGLRDQGTVAINGDFLSRHYNADIYDRAEGHGHKKP